MGSLECNPHELNFYWIQLCPSPALYHPTPFCKKCPGRPAVCPPLPTLKWSESRELRVQSGQAATRRTSPFSSTLKLSCPTDRMKVFVAAPFLLTLILTAPTCHGQPGYQSYDTRLFGNLPLGSAPSTGLTPYLKDQPELQRISEEPETAQGSHAGTMKVFAAVFAVILATAAFCPSASASPFASDTTPCCFGYINRVLPRNHIQEYFYTSSKCSMPAVVFVTRKKRQVCANPDSSWVKDYINILEMS
ncbi:uncharacterized protein LOC119231123 isoform X1 [Talpa occidentalis]|uniref:uncharacterized protein LOC119231123 isoform X1 n=1 Tax=Talpa occidentalis TaxID=50954 RepID=UPI00188EECFB|nr:uncharacterized protein LOC119231123 isoform X1 [Talpa occidentalis]